MNILQIVSFAFVVVLIMKVLGVTGEKYQIYVRIVAGLMIIVAACSQLDAIFSIIRDLALKIKMEGTYLAIIFKIIGIAYIVEFAHQICKEAKEELLASSIQFAGKVMIFVVASPIILALVELITQLL